MRKFGDEVLLHSQQRHPNIVLLIGVYYPPRSQLPMLVMEYLPLSLTQCLEREELPLQMKYSILLDVAKGLCYLHGKRPPIVHRDLTANNVLLTSSYSAKISDLGVSRLADTFKKHELTTAPGNAIVMPPEALEDNPVYDHKLDVFSYGCLILHVLTGQFPQPTNQFVPEPGKTKSFIKVPEWDRRSNYIKNIPKENEFLPLVKQCLNDAPTGRPEILYVLEIMQQVLLQYPKMKNMVEIIKEKEAAEIRNCQLDAEIKALKAEKETLEKQLTADQEQLAVGEQGTHLKQQVGGDHDQSTRNGEQLNVSDNEGQRTNSKEQAEDPRTDFRTRRMSLKRTGLRDSLVLKEAALLKKPPKEREPKYSTETKPNEQQPVKARDKFQVENKVAKVEKPTEKQLTVNHEQLTPGEQGTHLKQQVGGDRDHSTRDGEQLTPGEQGTHLKQQVGGDRDHSTRDGEQLTPGEQGTHLKQQVGGDHDHSTRNGEQLTPGEQGTHLKQQVGGDRDHLTRDGEQLTPGEQGTHLKQQVGGDHDHSTRDGEQLTPGEQGTHLKQQVGGDRDHSTRDGEQLTPGEQGTHLKQQVGGDRDHSTRNGEQLNVSDNEGQRTNSKEQAEDPRTDFRTRRMSLKRTGLRDSLVLKEAALLKKPPKEREPKYSTETKPNEQQPVKARDKFQVENKVAKVEKPTEKQLTVNHEQLTPGEQGTHLKQQVGGDRDHSTRDGEQLTPGEQGTHLKQQVGGDHDHSTRDGEQLTPGEQGTHLKQQVGGDHDHSTRNGEQLTPGEQGTHLKQQVEGDHDHSTRDGEQLTPGEQGTHLKQQVGGDHDHSTRNGEQLNVSDNEGQRTHPKEQTEDPKTDFRGTLKRTGLRDSLLLKEEESSNFTRALQQRDKPAVLKKPPKKHEPKHSAVTKANEQQPVKTREECQTSIVEVTKVSVKSSQALKDIVVSKKPNPSSIPLVSIQAQKEKMQPYLSQRRKKGDKWLV